MLVTAIEIIVLIFMEVIFKILQILQNLRRLRKIFIWVMKCFFSVDAPNAVVYVGGLAELHRMWD